MQDTGERFIPSDKMTQTALEHWHRYVSIVPHVHNKKVLDIASGAGYGSLLLAEHAHSVVGIDIDPEAIEYAQSNYHRDNLSYLQGSATAIPIPGNAVFDVIVSYETIEHISEADQALFLTEVKRLLKKDGVFIVSTPNKKIYTDTASGPKNHFHIKEFYKHEYTAFLQNYFPRVEIFGQQIYTTSLLWNLGEKKPAYTKEFNLHSDGLHTSGEEREPLYFVAFCSEVATQTPESSILIDTENGFVATVAESIRTTVEHALHESTSWKVTAPLRWTNAKIHNSRSVDLLNKTVFILRKQGFVCLLKKIQTYFVARQKSALLKTLPLESVVLPPSAILYIDHELGGGSAVYRNNYIRDSQQNNTPVVLVTYNIKSKKFSVQIHTKESVRAYRLEQLRDLTQLAHKTTITEIVVNGIVSYPHPLQTLEYITTLKNELDCPLTILIHDYFCIHPFVVMLDPTATYPQEIRETFEETIRREFSIFTDPADRDLTIWQQAWQQTLIQATHIVCFSQSSVDILMKHYPKLTTKQIQIVPHKVAIQNLANTYTKKDSEITTIGVLGNIQYVKGSSIIKEMVQEIDRLNLPIRIVVIGDIAEKIQSKSCIQTGKYEHANLRRIIERHAIDVFFVPSLCAETFSYTTEEIIQMGFPIASFAIGAPQERIKQYAKGHIISNISAHSALQELSQIKERIG